MAWTLSSLLVVFVMFLAVTVTVRGEGGVCVYMDRCTEDFNTEARKIGHDQESYCELRHSELGCFHRVISQCPTQQRLFAENQIKNAQADITQACDATSVFSSFLLLTLGTGMALLLGRVL